MTCFTPIDNTFRFRVSDLGVQQPDTQFGRDQPQRVGDVGGAEIDVIGARQTSPWLDLTTAVAEGLNSFRRSRSAHMLDELKRLSA